jgi:hypothetical protein
LKFWISTEKTICQSDLEKTKTVVHKRKEQFTFLPSEHTDQITEDDSYKAIEKNTVTSLH